MLLFLFFLSILVLYSIKLLQREWGVKGGHEITSEIYVFFIGLFSFYCVRMGFFGCFLWGFFLGGREGVGGQRFQQSSVNFSLWNSLTIVISVNCFYIFWLLNLLQNVECGTGWHVTTHNLWLERLLWIHCPERLIRACSLRATERPTPAVQVLFSIQSTWCICRCSAEETQVYITQVYRTQVYITQVYITQVYITQIYITHIEIRFWPGHAYTQNTCILTDSDILTYTHMRTHIHITLVNSKVTVMFSLV